MIEFNSKQLQEEISKCLDLKIKEYTEHIKEEFSSRFKPHFTKVEVCEFFGVSKGTIDYWVRNGELECYRVGQKAYYKRTQCEELIFSKQRRA